MQRDLWEAGTWICLRTGPPAPQMASARSGTGGGFRDPWLLLPLGSCHSVWRCPVPTVVLGRARSMAMPQGWQEPSDTVLPSCRCWWPKDNLDPWEHWDTEAGCCEDRGCTFWHTEMVSSQQMLPLRDVSEKWSKDPMG